MQNHLLFLHEIEGFIQRHLVRGASQKPATKAALDMRKLFVKKQTNKTQYQNQLGNYADMMDKIAVEKKKK